VSRPDAEAVSEALEATVVGIRPYQALSFNSSRIAALLLGATFGMLRSGDFKAVLKDESSHYSFCWLGLGVPMRVKSLKQLGKGSWSISAEHKAVLENAKVSRKVASGSPPHDLLWHALNQHAPGAIREYEGAVPGRRFRIDIAYEQQKLAVEIDGWMWHGKYLGDFKRDRLRQNLLTIHGWRILRFTAGDIYKNLDTCIEQVKTALG
jgi:very-short-patch-repair endonuclease